MDKAPCLPVKITDKKWADMMQNGSIFMRSLYEYGSWSAVKRAQEANQSIKNGIQGDISEGIVRRVDPKIGDDFFNLFAPEVRSVMKECMYIDEDRFQYYKVYCMYGLTYLIDERRYETPNDRINEFGDTAVIILQPDEFLHRLITGLNKQFGNNINFRLDEVHYYPPDYFGELDEFCKPSSFAWQNEMRIRVALLDEKNTITSDNGRVYKSLIQSAEPITVEIGDISDITVQIPVQDLIDLNLPDSIKSPVFVVCGDESTL